MYLQQAPSRKAPLLADLAFFALLLCITTAQQHHPQQQQQAPTTELPTDPSYWKGVNIFPFKVDTLAEPALLNELKEIAALGANWVVVNFEVLQHNQTSNVIYTSPEITPSRAVLSEFIDTAHSIGLKVFLKPLVVCEEGDCTFFTIQPSSPLDWFKSYGKYIQSFAAFAAQKEVEALSVGLEFYHLSGASYTVYWKEIINNVRAQYPSPGLLTYCSIFWPVETQQIQFWSDLDFIAMDTYVPFIKNATIDPSPTKEDMLIRFKGYFDRLNQWHSSQPANVSSLPIILTEAGYPSCKEGMANPAQNLPHRCEGLTYGANFTLQQMAFDALFETLAETTSLVRGVVVFWFDNPSSSDWYPNRNLPSSRWPCSWTPRGKPAECSIAKAYGGVSTTTKC